MLIRKFLAFAAAVMLSASSFASVSQDWRTLAEQTDFKKTPKFEETMQFFNRLAQKSDMVNVSSFGTSPQGRDLCYVTVDKDGLTSPEKIRAKGRIVILVQSCIHSGEPDGKDATMIFLRDMIINGRDKSLLKDVSFVFIPVFNVDGHEDFRATNRINQNGPDELGTRNTAQLLNLNRDYLKADAPEMKAWLKLYNKWNPELFIDCHVTNGADFQYVMTYDIENHGKAMSEPLHSFSVDTFDRLYNERMALVGFPLFPYCEYERSYAPELGGSLEVFDPRYSQSYVAYRNRLGLLLETHIYKPYKQRVMATLESIRQCAYILQEHKAELKRCISEADKATAGHEFRKDPYPLKYETDRSKVVYADYLGWQRDTLTSDLSGGRWVIHNYDKPYTYNMPLYKSQKPVFEVKVPRSYIIMPQYSYLAELLDLHGLKYSVLQKAEELEVEAYHYTKGVFSTRQSEGRVPVVSLEYETKTEKILCPAGSIVVDMAQANAKLALYLFEPSAPGSLAYWGFFNAHLQPGNEFWILPSYMEVKGREMLRNEPETKAAFEEKMKDPQFASDPDAILGFFYEICRRRSHQDNDIHPVLRVLD